MGTQTQDKRGLVFPGFLSAGPELVEQCRGRVWERNIQGSVPGIVSPCTGLAEGPQLCVGSWPSTVTDFIPSREWTVPILWKLPVFSWLGLGGCGNSQADRGTCARSPSQQGVGQSGPFAHCGLAPPLPPSLLPPARGVSPEATCFTVCLQGHALTPVLALEQRVVPPTCLVPQDT